MPLTYPGKLRPFRYLGGSAQFGYYYIVLFRLLGEILAVKCIGVFSLLDVRESVSVV